MPDIVDAQTRSRMMAGIKAKNTKPELSLRKALHRRGFRYTLHPANVIGKPDLVLPAYSAVIFLHGCFWHGHHCRFFRWPGTRQDFWKQKILANQSRDRVVAAELRKLGWRRLVVWECAVRGKDILAVERIAERTAAWLTSDRASGTISGK